MFRIVSENRKWTEADREKSIANHLRGVLEQLGERSSKKIPEEAIEKYRKYLTNTVPDSSRFWTAKALGTGFKDEEELKTGLASDILASLGNIVCPCHYVLKSIFERGFGPTGAMRRATYHKPIFSFVNYNRLYKQFEGQTGTREVSPHFRKGHVRHHWKLAGIDRFTLPDDPFERLRFALQRKVKRSYIPPTWVGPTVMTEEGVTHEIITEEMPMRTT